MSLHRDSWSNDEVRALRSNRHRGGFADQIHLESCNHLVDGILVVELLHEAHLVNLVLDGAEANEAIDACKSLSLHDLEESEIVCAHVSIRSIGKANTVFNEVSSQVC